MKVFVLYLFSFRGNQMMVFLNRLQSSQKIPLLLNLIRMVTLLPV